MNSLDTNILVYAANREAPEHGKALAVVRTMLAQPSEWILADQVLWEFYPALRHPRIPAEAQIRRPGGGAPPVSPGGERHRLLCLRTAAGVTFAVFHPPTKVW
jgi:hypothetical protein